MDRAAEGEEIVIAKAGRPLARLVPLEGRGGPREPGGWEGQVHLSDDFDAPLPKEIAAAFGSGETEELSMLLLDTHIVIWWRAQPSRLPSDLREEIAAFDRILVAQAQLEGLELVIRDGTIARYDVPGRTI